MSFTGLGQTLEHHALDLWYRLRPVAAVPPDLLIVGIDEASFQELRRPWPWPRRLHAELVERLAAAGARLIVFDVIFADPADSQDDQALAQAMANAGNVILGETFEISQDPQFSRQILVQPLRELREAARQVGVSMVTPDGDGMVRRFCLRLGGLDTLAAATVRSLTPSIPLPTDLTGLINYVGPPRSIDTVSYYQILDQDRPLPASRVRDRIVLVGRMLEASVTPQGQADAFYTPFFAGSGRLMAGVEVQGNIIYSLIRGQWGRELPGWARVLVYFLAFVLAGQILATLSPLRGISATLGLMVVIGGLSFNLFGQWQIWMPPALLCGGLLLIYTCHPLGQYLVEAREKRWLRQAFGRYVSPTLVEAITGHPERLQLGGEELEVTILFSDLEGFTSLSEDMAPQALINLLNEYFTPMTQIILDHQGTLDKFMGDAIMALWGAPWPLPDHAGRACRAALAMQAALGDLQADWRRRGLPPLTARIGLHSGVVVAGNVGSRERFNYTVIGDTVNLASRLEGANKLYGTDILLSDTTYRLAADHLLVRELDQVQVKGRIHPVTLYELLGPLPPQGTPAWLERFAQGREAYLQRRWDRAADFFQEVLLLHPDDAASRVYLQRCRRYREQPPPPEWDGVHHLESK